MLVISWPVPSKSVAGQSREERNRHLCSLIPSDSHETFFQPFDDLHIHGVYLIFFGFGIRIYPYHITRLDAYFLHLAGAHFVPLACAHCYCPGGRSKLYYIILYNIFFVIFNYVIFYYIVLYFIILHCIILY